MPYLNLTALNLSPADRDYINRRMRTLEPGIPEDALAHLLGTATNALANLVHYTSGRAHQPDDIVHLMRVLYTEGLLEVAQAAHKAQAQANAPGRH